ncbi:SIR2 family protein [Chitinophaga pinensis]|uniref:SIR2-like domain-containing protein n=1 Tax=Chitinophaga pinensis (strain ATCC 43595 / DSM 2588 / LMG 13176 / NBRC 15968 / NCIMB 11800 / UQM 2034) TaxID=485918 RepID=A0A979G3U6_CHIPD|nr:SIR2 family protein [Chitinophaga pinensis]ACU60294.1 hypothetical protein Cpin_2815 [Chitinophaga pinensis DSM 2588]
MVFSDRQLHKIQTILYQRPANLAEVYLKHANIHSPLSGGATNDWVKWGEALAFVNSSKERMKRFLEEALKSEELPVLRYYYNELLSSRENRLLQLAHDLITGRCVVFLGPDVLTLTENRNIVSFNEWMSYQLMEEMNLSNVYYDKNLRDNLSYMASCYREMPNYVHGDIAHLSKEKFEEHLKSRRINLSLYQELSKLPLKIVINANPDELLYNEINKIKTDGCRLAYYDMSCRDAGPEPEELSDMQVSDDGEFSPGQTVVYNLFGSFRNESSVLHTEAEFLDFISRVTMGNPKIDEELLSEFNEKDSYLFLGFDFEQWYFKVLFHLFKLKKEQNNAVSCNVEDNDPNKRRRISPSTREFFEEEFRMFFVNDELVTFIADLNAVLTNITPRIV